MIVANIKTKKILFFKSINPHCTLLILLSSKRTIFSQFICWTFQKKERKIEKKTFKIYTQKTYINRRYSEIVYQT